MDGEGACARSEGEQIGVGGPLVDGNTCEVVRAVATPSVRGCAGESDGDHCGLAEVDRPIISEVAADGQGVCGGSGAGLEGAAHGNSSVAAQRQRASRCRIVLQDARNALTHCKIEGDCGGVYGDGVAIGNSNVICGRWHEAARPDGGIAPVTRGHRGAENARILQTRLRRRHPLEGVRRAVRL